MKKALITGSSLVAAFSVPLFAFAAATPTDLTSLGTTIVSLINNILVPLIFSLAFIVFIWGAFNTFILGANSEDVREKGKNLMLYSLIGFFVMVSIWGLVNILTNTVDLNSTTPDSVPTTDPGIFNPVS
ncbi:MAG TPA: hypothetical protein VM103_01715 [Candidatus Paceibacterota bacterium]|nr:hypothetical protein [Candidatus Paceibacterota bacterium]